MVNFYLCPFAEIDRVTVEDDGSQRVSRVRLPRVGTHVGSRWWATANDGINALVAVPSLTAGEAGAIGVDSLIDALGPSVYAKFGIPDNGARDEAAIVEWAAKCLLLRQLVGGLPLDLATKFEDSDPAVMAALQQAHTGRKALDTSEARSSRSLAVVFQSLAEQLSVRTEPGQPRPRGTFTDDFEGFTELDDLDVSDDWTRVDGSAFDIDIGDTGSDLIATCNNSNTQGLYVCPDQGGSAQYVQITQTVGSAPKGRYCNRATDKDNLICWEAYDTVNNNDIIKYDTGTPTSLASDTSTSTSAGDVKKLESDDADAHEGFLDTGSGFTSFLGPATDAFNNTETRQGLSAQSTSGARMANDFEAGLLGGGGGAGSGGDLLLRGVG